LSFGRSKAPAGWFGLLWANTQSRKGMKIPEQLALQRYFSSIVALDDLAINRLINRAFRAAKCDLF
jgi:hypothetical protein